MSLASAETPVGLVARVEEAVRARTRLRHRPLGVTIAALVAAAHRWLADEALAAGLPDTTRLSPPMIATVLPFAAEALDTAAMTELVEHAWGAGAAARPPGAGPVVIVHVLASNVPALALPAIALGCLAGATVVVKSGRDDPLSAPAFQRALAAVDPELAATVVATYWRGGDRAHEEAVIGRADVVVATGGDAAVAATAARVRGRFLAHGPRWSVAVVGRDPIGDTAATADTLAHQIVVHDQRGCLSPHVVYVERDADTLAHGLAAALERLATRLPRGQASVEERAAVRVFRSGAAWEPGATVLGGLGGIVVHSSAPGTFQPTCGQRSVRVHPLPSLDALPAFLPPGTIECVGVTAADPTPLVAALQARGVARVCPLGRMQRPRLTWPRGQQPALGALLAPGAPPEIEVEP